jgi:hypothetical protein
VSLLVERVTNGMEIHIRRDDSHVCDDGRWWQDERRDYTLCGQRADTLYGDWRPVDGRDAAMLECRECHLRYYHGGKARP